MRDQCGCMHGCTVEFVCDLFSMLQLFCLFAEPHPPRIALIGITTRQANHSSKAAATTTLTSLLTLTQLVYGRPLTASSQSP